MSLLVFQKGQKRSDFYQKGGICLQVLDVSFDKITIVGDLHPDFYNQFQKLYIRTDVDVWEAGHDRIKGQFFKKVYFEFDRLKGQAFKRRNFRMELNPNHMDQGEILWLQNTIAPMLSDMGISRLDLCFDVDFNLGEYIFILKSPKNTVEFKNKAGKLETLYIGRRESDKMIRCYDKKAERKSNADINVNVEEWWRLEFELKRESVNDFVYVFDELQIKKPELSELKSFNDRAGLYYLLNNTNEWLNLSKDKKTRYRKLLREIVNEDITNLFKKALKKKEKDLLRQVDKWFAKQYKVFDFQSTISNQKDSN